MADDTTDTTEKGAPADPPAPPTPDPETETDKPPAQLPDDHPLVKAHAAKKDELAKAKAKLKEFEDRDKTEAEKAAEAAATEKERADKAEADLARARAAVKYGLTEDDLDLLGTGTAEEIDARAKRLADRLGTADKGRRTPTDTLGRTDEGDQKVDVKAIVDSIPSTA